MSAFGHSRVAELCNGVGKEFYFSIADSRKEVAQRIVYCADKTEKQDKLERHGRATRAHRVIALALVKRGGFFLNFSLVACKFGLNSAQLRLDALSFRHAFLLADGCRNHQKPCKERKQNDGNSVILKADGVINYSEQEAERYAENFIKCGHFLSSECECFLGGTGS